MCEAASIERKQQPPLGMALLEQLEAGYRDEARSLLVWARLKPEEREEALRVPLGTGPVLEHPLVLLNKEPDERGLKNLHLVPLWKTGEDPRWALAPSAGIVCSPRGPLDLRSHGSAVCAPLLLSRAQTLDGLILRARKFKASGVAVCHVAMELQWAAKMRAAISVEKRRKAKQRPRQVTRHKPPSPAPVPWHGPEVWSPDCSACSGHVASRWTFLHLGTTTTTANVRAVSFPLPASGCRAECSHCQRRVTMSPPLHL